MHLFKHTTVWNKFNPTCQNTMASSLHCLILLAFMFLATGSLAYEATGVYCNHRTIVSPSDPIHSSISQFTGSLFSNFAGGATFLESSYGKGNTAIYSLAQCRGDVNLTQCLDCIQKAAFEIGVSCPSNTDARIWHDYCFLRYSQDNFYSYVDTSEGLLFLNPENVTSTSADTLIRVLGELFNEIYFDGAIPASRSAFGTGVRPLSKFDTLYFLAQCTKDLSAPSCFQCLNVIMHHFQKECSWRKGCRVMFTSCSVRYELYPFFYPLPVGTKEIPDESLEKLIIHP